MGQAQQPVINLPGARQLPSAITWAIQLVRLASTFQAFISFTGCVGV